ncbi:MAG: SIS domain-containing protein [Deltaproteobacteria bacterium]|nr:SIS domain-containing protein [Deltaproteobacteria bacterium]
MANPISTIESYLSSLRQAILAVPTTKIREIIDLILSARKADKQMFLFGNGGSAATASHFACDLAKGTIVPGKRRFRVISLCDQIPVMTAWANDADYSEIFVEQLRNIMNAGDLVIGITSSGNSPNVVKALKYAKVFRAQTVALTGFQGGKVKEIVDHCLIVPSSTVQIIEDVHLALGHAISIQLHATIKAEAIKRQNVRRAKSEVFPIQNILQDLPLVVEPAEGIKTTKL